jgi:hypothetical protein
MVWKEAVVIYHEILFQHMLEWTKENHEKPQSGWLVFQLWFKPPPKVLLGPACLVPAWRAESYALDLSYLFPITSLSSCKSLSGGATIFRIGDNEFQACIYEGWATIRLLHRNHPSLIYMNLKWMMIPQML